MPKPPPPWPAPTPIEDISGWAPEWRDGGDGSSELVPDRAESFERLIGAALGLEVEKLRLELDDALFDVGSTATIHPEVLFYCLRALQGPAAAVRSEPARRRGSAELVRRAGDEEDSWAQLAEARRQNIHRVATPWGIVLDVPVDVSGGRPRAWPREVGALVVDWLLRRAGGYRAAERSAITFALMRVTGITTARPKPERLVADLNTLLRRALEWIPAAHGQLAVPPDLVPDEGAGV